MRKLTREQAERLANLREFAKSIYRSAGIEIGERDLDAIVQEKVDKCVQAMVGHELLETFPELKRDDGIIPNATDEDEE